MAMHVVGTAGHVDHGKSTLVRALTGIDPDRFAEEKRRGLTIDLGFAWLTLPSGREVGIVDVPGHERFIRNMLAGVGGIDAAVFVVAADEGWMPQSAEHLQILDFLAVDRAVVALTKTDLVDADLVELAREETASRLATTSLAGAAIVDVSAETGHGLDALRDALDGLLADTPPAPDNGRPRLFIDRAFTITGAGTVVTGTLTGGALRTDQRVTLLPSRVQARVRSLQTHAAPVDVAVPGSRVAANLVGVDRHQIARGDVLVDTDWRVTEHVAARVRVSSDHPMAERGAHVLHLGSSDTTCTVRLLDAEGDTVAPGASALADIYTSTPVVTVPGDRFVLRDVGRRQTVAGGVVLDVAPPTLRRGDGTQLAALRAREDLEALPRTVVVELGAVAAADLGALTGADPETLADVVRTPSFLVDPRRAGAWRNAAADRLAEHHNDHPLEAGMARDALASAIGVDLDLLDELLTVWDGIVQDGPVIRLPSHGSTLSEADRARADAALDTLRAAGASPPAPSEAGLDHDLAKALERTGELVFTAPDVAYAADTWQDIAGRVTELITTSGPATVSVIRETLGTSRRYAVPLLEKLDAEGVTRRRGDVRELGPRAT